MTINQLHTPFIFKNSLTFHSNVVCVIGSCLNTQTVVVLLYTIAQSCMKHAVHIYILRS